MPLYNAASPSPALLLSSVQSVLHQSFPHFLFLLIDDGSTDSTLAVISPFLATDARVRLLRHDSNAGVAVSLNDGVRWREAEGETDAGLSPYIARMDGDDVCHERRLELQWRHMEEHREVDVLGTAVTVVSSSSSSRIVSHPTDSLMAEWAMQFYCSLAHPSVLVRRSVLAQQPYSNSGQHRHVEDYHLWLSLLRLPSPDFPRPVTLSNLPSPPLVTLSRLPSSVSSLHRREQQHRAVHCLHQHLLLSLRLRISLRAVEAMIRPAEADWAAERGGEVVALLLAMEAAAKEKEERREAVGLSSRAAGLREVEADVTKRIGEVAMLCLKASGKQQRQQQRSDNGAETGAAHCGLSDCDWEGEEERLLWPALPPLSITAREPSALLSLWLKRGGDLRSQAVQALIAVQPQ